MKMLFSLIALIATVWVLNSVEASPHQPSRAHIDIPEITRKPGRP